VCPPRFPHRHFPVARFGAKGDGVTDCSTAFADAIRACARAGGGHVRPAEPSQVAARNPDVGGITVDNLVVAQAQRALNLRGYPDDPVGETRLSNVDFQHTSQPSVVANVASLVLADVLENGEPMSA
jgi:polygalacturonase